MNKPFIVRILDRVEQLLIDSGNLGESRQTSAQIAGQSPPLDKGHNQIQDSLLIAILNQRQDVRMMQTCDGSCLAHKAATHIAISSVVTKNNLDGYAPIKRGALFA